VTTCLDRPSSVSRWPRMTMQGAKFRWNACSNTSAPAQYLCTDRDERHSTARRCFSICTRVCHAAPADVHCAWH
jgi:hypothetical protein